MVQSILQCKFEEKTNQNLSASHSTGSCPLTKVFEVPSKEIQWIHSIKTGHMQADILGMTFGCPKQRRFLLSSQLLYSCFLVLCLTYFTPLSQAYLEDRQMKDRYNKNWSFQHPPNNVQIRKNRTNMGPWLQIYYLLNKTTKFTNCTSLDLKRQFLSFLKLLM